MRLFQLYLLLIFSILLFSVNDSYGQDTDGDGLSDSDEINIYTTDPTKPDTDGDGLTDGFEIDNLDVANPGNDAPGYDPLTADVDDDGLLDGEETQGTANSILSQVANPNILSPFLRDSDGDGISDGDEFNHPTFDFDPTLFDTDDDNLDDGRELELGTDPSNPDTDGDGLSDGDEANFLIGIGSDPLKSDTDGDGISDGQEFNQGTDPTKIDSDGDGLDDDEEIARNTFPLDADSDNDGLTDGAEVNTHNTNPLEADSDGDGCEDNQEVLSGSDPNDPSENTGQFYIDNDGDGFGDPSSFVISCETPVGYAANANDCNDNNPNLGAPQTWFRDNDGDGFGADGQTITNCSQPAGYVAQGGDCNDSNDEIYPGAPTQPNGLDNNCDGIIEKFNQQITFEVIANKVFTDGSFTLAVTASSGLPVTLSAEGPITISGQEVTIIGAGVASITASQAGNASYNAAENVTRTFEIVKGSQILTFDPIPDATFGDPDIQLFATVSTGLPITFTIQGSGTFNADTSAVIINAAGTVTVTARQLGNANFNPSEAIQRTFDIQKADQILEIENKTLFQDAVFDSLKYPLSVAVSSGLLPNVEVTGPAILEDDSVVITGAGLVTVIATQDGNENFNAAVPDTVSFSIFKRTQDITMDSLQAVVVSSPFVLLNASTSENLPVTYLVEGPVNLMNDTLFIENAGIVTVEAFNPGNENINPTDTIRQTFCINPLPPTVLITLAEPDSVVVSSSSAENIAWYSNGALLPDENEQFITVVDTGYYEVFANVNVEGCFSANSDTISFNVIDPVTGISKSFDKGLIELYPNPVSSSITINVPLELSSAKPEIFVFTLQGSRILEIPIQRSGNQWSALHDISTLAPGVYILGMTIEERFTVFRIIKD